MTYNELQRKLNGEIKILLILFVLLNRLSWAISKRIRRKSQHLAEEIGEDALGIFDEDLNDMQDICETNIIIANRYAYPRIGKVGEK